MIYYDWLHVSAMVWKQEGILLCTNLQAMAGCERVLAADKEVFGSKSLRVTLFNYPSQN